MSQQASQQRRQTSSDVRDPVAEYISALEQFYPAAIGSASVHLQPNNQVIVCVPLPNRVTDRMRLFDQMAEVATKLLVETDQLIILSSQ